MPNPDKRREILANLYDLMVASAMVSATIACPLGVVGLFTAVAQQLTK